MNMEPDISRPDPVIFPDVEEMSREAASLIVETAIGEVTAKGCFTLVLSGGQTPRRLFEMLSGDPYTGRMPWEKTHLFWGDERFVPRGHPESNFATACRAMISEIPLPIGNVHPVPLGGDSPEASAEIYEDRIRDFFGLGDGDDEIPSFDLVLLGMGADGHTASLFPGSDVLGEDVRWVRAAEAPEGQTVRTRITMTLPLINAARRVLFLVSGHEKSALVREIREDREKAGEKYPAGMVRPAGDLLWFIGGE